VKTFILSILHNKINSDSYLLMRKLIPETPNELIKLLLNRIELLEIQNFSLITRNEQYINMMKKYIDDLVEYSEVIIDIKNVINQVYDSQTLTKEYFIIRDTLNGRSEYLIKRKQIFTEEKVYLDQESLKDLNNEILTNDKILEKINEFSNNKFREALDERINLYEGLKAEILNHEENMEANNNEEGAHSSLQNSLLQQNNWLKMNNYKMKKLIIDLLKHKEIEVTDDMNKLLNDVLSETDDFVFSEDLFYLLKSQALLLENIVI
jgi:hypothetical protein